MSTSHIFREVISELGFEGSPGYRTSEELLSSSKEAKQSVEEMGIDAAYEFSSEGYSPIIYFKTFESYDDEKVSELHRKIWNENRAQFLVLVSPEKIEIINCRARPSTKGDQQRDDSQQRILESLRIEETSIENSSELQQFARSNIDSRNFRQSWKDSIDHEPVDEILLQDLTSLNTELTKGLSEKYANALIVRSIFILYLEDRGVLDASYYSNLSGNEFRDLLNDPQSTYAFFDEIKDRLNGDIFNTLEGEREAVEDEDLKRLRLALSGYDFDSGQKRLFPYDFGLIPVETISGIYDDFVRGKESNGVHYTPQRVVQFMQNDMLSESVDREDIILDPACGSGVFLVNLLDKMVDSQGHDDPEEIMNVLDEQIYGIDKSQDATRITVFSLYLKALSHLSNSQIREGEFQLPQLLNENILVGDFFNIPSESLPDADVIVGNPPWGNVAKEGTPGHTYIKQRELPIASNEISQCFLWKCLEIAKSETTICMLIPMKGVMLNLKSQEFRERFIQRIDIDSVVNLSLFRKELFNSALNPGAIIKFSPGTTDSKVQYVTPKPPDAKAYDSLIIDGGFDVKYIPSEFLGLKGVWKMGMWGGFRDFQLLQRLTEKNTLSDQVKELNLKSRQGFIKWESAPRERKTQAQWLSDLPYLPLSNLRRYSINPEALEPMDTEYFNRPRDPNIYSGPLLAIHRTATKDNSRSSVSYSIKSAYSEKSVSFNQNVLGISSEDGDTGPYLKIINLIINSKLAQYYLFMTSVSWTVERPKLRQQEVMNIPCVLPDEGGELYNRLLSLHEEVSSRIREEGLEVNKDLQKEIDSCIFDLYDLTHEERQIVVDRVNYTIDFFHNGDSSLGADRLEQDDLERYVETLSAILNRFIEDQTVALQPKIYKSTEWQWEKGEEREDPLNLVTLSLRDEDNEHIQSEVADQDLREKLEEIDDRVITREGETIYFSRYRDIINRDQIHLIRPNEVRFWTKAEAVNDAHELIGGILG